MEVVRVAQGALGKVGKGKWEKEGRNTPGRDLRSSSEQKYLAQCTKYGGGGLKGRQRKATHRSIFRTPQRYISNDRLYECVNMNVVIVYSLCFFIFYFFLQPPRGHIDIIHRMGKRPETHRMHNHAITMSGLGTSRTWTRAARTRRPGRARPLRARSGTGRKTALHRR